MPDIPTLLAAATLLVWLYATVELVRGSRRLTSIMDVTPAPPAQLPTASVVVAARDEERHIRDAMRTLFALDHPALEIIAVDDRSSDGTGAILDALATEDPRLSVEHVTALPGGWLGKNHALHQGALRARGEFILFTDADIYLAPDVLRRAVTLMQAERLDHLVVGPLTIGGSAPMRALLSTFAVLFSLGTRPWRAPEAGRPEHVGIGAFNLVRASALRQVGGLEAVRLRPDDDIKLGKVLKAAGLRQRFVRGEGTVRVEWYRTATEMVRGLEKNSFPFLDYSVPKTVQACVALALLGVWPWLALFLVSGAAWWLDLAVVCLSGALVAGAAQQTLRLSRWYGLALPFGVLLMIVTLLNSMWRTLAQGGVVWRGTLYPLAALRANRV
jgi:glycosyltransferase involved in cell wall biosynthesis